jgi:DNA (cytosine-5)-methyltransferase 1
MLGYAATCGREEKADTNRTKNCAYGTDCGGMAQGARKQSVDFGRSGDGIYINPDKSVTLKGTDGGGGAATGLYMLPVYTVIGNVISRKVKSGGNQPGISDDGVAPTLTARDRHAVVYAQYQTEDSKAYGPSGFAEYREGVGALRASRGGAGGGKENLIVSKRKVQGIIKHVVRRLTPTECELLQGYPVGWTLLDTKGKQISDNARYKALGNSLAVPCAERVFIGIVAAEQEERA